MNHAIYFVLDRWIAKINLMSVTKKQEHIYIWRGQEASVRSEPPGTIDRQANFPNRNFQRESFCRCCAFLCATAKVNLCSVCRLFLSALRPCSQSESETQSNSSSNNNSSSNVDSIWTFSITMFIYRKKKVSATSCSSAVAAAQFVCLSVSVQTIQSGALSVYMFIYLWTWRHRSTQNYTDFYFKCVCLVTELFLSHLWISFSEKPTSRSLTVCVHGLSCHATECAHTHISFFLLIRDLLLRSSVKTLEIDFWAIANIDILFVQHYESQMDQLSFNFVVYMKQRKN